MKAYFVRKSENREVVGFFVAQSPARLAAIVDECCDPAICDYAEAGAGGLTVAGQTDARWPRPAIASGSGLEDAVLTQQWEDDLSESESGLEWRPLRPAALRMLRGLGRPANGGKPA